MKKNPIEVEDPRILSNLSLLIGKEIPVPSSRKELISLKEDLWRDLVGWREEAKAVIYAHCDLDEAISSGPAYEMQVKVEELERRVRIFEVDAMNWPSRWFARDLWQVVDEKALEEGSWRLSLGARIRWNPDSYQASLDEFRSRWALPEIVMHLDAVELLGHADLHRAHLEGLVEFTHDVSGCFSRVRLRPHGSMMEPFGETVARIREGVKK